MSSLTAIHDINGIKPGVIVSPYSVFTNTDIKTVRFGGMELYSTDIRSPFPELSEKMKVLEITQEYGRKVCYMERI